MRHHFTIISIASALSMIAAAIVIAQTRPAETVPDRLRALGQAIQIYATENRGYVPNDLALLKQILHNDEFVQQAQKDFVYVATTRPTKIPQLRPMAQYPIAVSKPRDDKDAIWVLFVDGHVQEYVPVNGSTTRPATQQ
jgi:hypothetical protein